MSKRRRLRMNMVFLYFISIFTIIVVNLALVAGIVVLLLRLNIITTFVSTPMVIVFLIILSLILTGIVIALGSKISLKPVRVLIDAMKELAGGNLNVRINMDDPMYPIEFTDFAERFNETAKELASIEMLRSDFVNNFSHEFKTPIASIRGFAKLLKNGNLTPEEEEEYLDIMISESDRLSELATNVLNLSKIQNQMIITDGAFFDMGEQVRRVILMMESGWAGKNLELEIDIDDIIFYGSQELLSQIWLNILDNAVKFSSSGGKLRIKLLDQEDMVVFKVRDFGCGMDPETKARMFDKFFQGDYSRATGGNGLGLAIVDRIVSLHQGKISVDSEPGKGTSIAIILPKLPAEK